jgi:hypothetical protein
MYLLLWRLNDKKFFIGKDADFTGVLLPGSYEQLSGPLAVFFAGIYGQNWFFFKDPAAHAQIFVDNPFLHTGSHYMFGGALPKELF